MHGKKEDATTTSQSNIFDVSRKSQYSRQKPKKTPWINIMMNQLTRVVLDYFFSVTDRYVWRAAYKVLLAN